MARQLELLAPAGNWAAMEAVVGAGADAVYLGGKRFNMRLLRPDFNFSDQELQEAVQFCHDKGVRLYTTVNNLYYDDELEGLGDYLAYLNEIGVDAVIAQDLAVAEIMRARSLKTELHASVQMGVRNIETANLLADAGFSRAVFSKNLNLDELSAVRDQGRLEIEFFVHGDQCITHTGQCYMSDYITGDSGNRGKCRKPCRWVYRLEPDGLSELKGFSYYLAHNDFCFMLDLPRLIRAGVTSFKIEGRMRDPEYVAFLVSVYRKAVDRFIHDIQAVQNSDDDYRLLVERRIRNYTTGSVIDGILPDIVDPAGSREPFFPTSPRALIGLSASDYQDDTAVLLDPITLSVKADSAERVQAAINCGVDRIILPAYPGRKFSRLFQSSEEIISAAAMCRQRGIKVAAELPRIVSVKDMERLVQWMGSELAHQTDIIIAHDPGSLSAAAASGKMVWAGYGLNLTNEMALMQVKTWGASAAQPSMEMALPEYLTLVQHSPLPLDIQIHGPLVGMISDVCPIRDVSHQGNCPPDCPRCEKALIDQLEQRYRLECDGEGRILICHPQTQAFYHRLPQLLKAGADSVRIDGTGETGERLETVIRIYQEEIRLLTGGAPAGAAGFQTLLRAYPDGLTEQPLIQPVG